MSEDIVKQTGVMSAYKDDRGGAALYSHPIIGVVKNNIDPLRTGKIQVWLDRMNSTDDNNPDHWTTVSYLSPFMGFTPNTGSPEAFGDYVGNRNSYGFWATPPDLGTQVICIFINGDPNFGYYIGAIPLEGLTHMIPAIGSSTEIIPNDGEAKSYGGATRLPVTEYNDANQKQDNSATPQKLARPVHSVQAAILNNQGLLRDPDRGTISSSSTRESPSNVFGMSTPGRPIYTGGYTNETIASALSDGTVPATNFKVIGRTGGHSLVMDDGDVQGRDQLMRLRTAGGHMIMMNDYAGTLFIIHANGTSYIELGKEGTIDLYSTNSVNVRTQGDLNLHADNNININAKKDLNVSAENIKIESLKNSTQFVGTTLEQFIKGDHTIKVNSRYSVQSTGDSMIKSGGTNYLVGGPNVHLNTGESSLVPKEVQQLPIIVHTDTLRDEEKGYAPAPGKLPSIVTRAPAHSPWANACQGVDVKTDLSAASQLPVAPSASVTQVNDSTLPAKITPTTPSLSATVPPAAALSRSLDAQSTGTLISQMAVNAANGPAASIVQKGAGILETAGQKVAAIGLPGFNPAQLVSSGVLKPGSAPLVDSLIQKGKSIAEAIPTNLFTGKDGITSVTNIVNSSSAQVSVGANLLKSAEQGLKATGLISGNESSTQIGGLILGGAQAGLGATLDFAKKAMSDPIGASTIDLNSTLTNAMGLGQNGSLRNALEAAGTNMGKSLNPIIGSVDKAIASGNNATALADKALGTLGGVDVTDSLRGMSAGAFTKVTSSFKALKGKIPQNLTVAKAAAEAEGAAQEAATNVASASDIKSLDEKLKGVFGVQPGGALRTALETTGSQITSNLNAAGLLNQQLPSQGVPSLSQAQGILGNVVQNVAPSMKGLVDQVKSGSIPGVPSIPGIPGGLGAVTGIIDKAGAGLDVPGLDTLKNTVKDISPSNLGSQLNGLPATLKEKGLAGFAKSGLPPSAAAALQGAISSLGSPGGLQVKAPTIALDTFDFSSILNKSKDLLGDVKIPNLNLGNLKIPSQPLSAEQIKEYDKVKAEVDVLLDETRWETRRKFFDLKAAQKEGKATQEQVAAAEAAYKECLQKIETLQKKLADIAQGIQST